MSGRGDTVCWPFLFLPPARFQSLILSNRRADLVGDEWWRWAKSLESARVTGDGESFDVSDAQRMSGHARKLVQRMGA